MTAKRASRAKCAHCRIRVVHPGWRVCEPCYNTVQVQYLDFPCLPRSTVLAGRTTVVYIEQCTHLVVAA